MRRVGKLAIGIVGLQLAMGAIAGQASAALVSALPGGTGVSMPVLNYWGPGPITFGDITWSSTNASSQGGSVFGFTLPYGYLSNGGWDGAMGPMAGLNDSFDFYGVTDTMTFTFDTPVAGIGGFINYAPGSTNPTIAVYDSLGGLIESTTLNFLTGGGNNTGQFLGFLESSAIIKSFTLTDNYIGITGLTVMDSGNPVPIPGAALLLGSGLTGLAAWSRRKKK